MSFYKIAIVYSNAQNYNLENWMIFRVLIFSVFKYNTEDVRIFNQVGSDKGCSTPNAKIGVLWVWHLFLSLSLIRYVKKRLLFRITSEIHAYILELSVSTSILVKILLRSSCCHVVWKKTVLAQKYT